jgi:hypothetical protein
MRTSGMSPILSDGIVSALRPEVNWLSLIQWPAMIVTVLAGWLTASTSDRRRKWGFWLFLGSNVLWVVWGVGAHAWALIVLQVSLVFTNIRGVRKNEQAEKEA